MTALVTADELAVALGLPTPTDEDSPLNVCADAASSWLVQYLTPDVDHSEHAYCRRAALEVAVNMWQSATAAGGQPVNADFTPAPYQMGASLLRRVAGIIAPCRPASGLVG